MRRMLLLGLALVAGLLVVARLVAPIVGLRFVNGLLATLPDYQAHVDDLDLHLLSQSVTLHRLEIVRPAVDGPPFVAVDEIVVHPHLRPALHGDHIVDVDLFAPHVTYVLGPDASTSQISIDPQWIAELLKRFPATVDHLSVERGALRYIDHAAKPDIDLTLVDVALTGTNLANLERVTEPRFGHVTANGQLFEKGKMALELDLDPYADAPDFQLDATASSISLVGLNDAFRAYGHFDLEAGTASGRTSINAHGGGYEGTVDPVVSHLQVVRLKTDSEDKKNPLRFVWESIVGTAGDLASLATPGKDEIQLQVPVKGTFKDKSLVGNVIELLPRAWFGTLLHAFSAATVSGKEAAKLVAEAVPIIEKEKAEPKRHRR